MWDLFLPWNCLWPLFSDNHVFAVFHPKKWMNIFGRKYVGMRGAFQRRWSSQESSWWSVSTASQGKVLNSETIGYSSEYPTWGHLWASAENGLKYLEPQPWISYQAAQKASPWWLAFRVFCVPGSVPTLLQEFRYFPGSILMSLGMDTDGKIIWKISGKIIQNPPM